MAVGSELPPGEVAFFSGWFFKGIFVRWLGKNSFYERLTRLEDCMNRPSNGYSKRIVLHFTKEIWDKPIVYRLVKEYNLIFNILKANVLPRQKATWLWSSSEIQKRILTGASNTWEKAVSAYSPWKKTSAGWKKSAYTAARALQYAHPVLLP